MEYVVVDEIAAMKEAIVTMDSELGDAPLRRVVLVLERGDDEFEFEFVYVPDDGWSLVI